MSVAAPHDPTLPLYAEPGENPTQREFGDNVPEDFKYAEIVSECAIEIRHRFLQRVYLLLAAQVALTASVSAAMILSPGFQNWVFTHTWSMWVSVIGSFVFMVASIVLRRRYPWNLILLSVFTLCEGWLVGTVTAVTDTSIVIDAFIITAVVFVGLSLFAAQTKYDFTSWAPYLGMFVWALLGVGLVSLFTKSSALDLVYSYAAVVLFSVFIIVDTQTVMNACHPEDIVVASLMFYMDIVNLFLNILAILSSANSDSN